MLFPSLESHTYALHANLAKHNVLRAAIGTPTEHWESDERSEFEYRILEGHYLEELRDTVKPLIPTGFTSADSFVSWFESLNNKGPGQHHPLLDWLANDCSLEQLKWFLTQEVIGDLDFADLLSAIQINLPMQAKLECARNFWDEMGRGKADVTHADLLNRMVKGLDLQPSIADTVWESLALNNTMIGLATTRRYAYHALGALGVTELITPHYATKISQGMKRLGLDRWVCSYFELKAALDVAHSRGWIKEIIFPLVSKNPECAQFLAEGAMMRLTCGQLCFDRYAHELKLFNAIEKNIHHHTLYCQQLNDSERMAS